MRGRHKVETWENIIHNSSQYRASRCFIATYLALSPLHAVVALHWRGSSFLVPMSQRPRTPRWTMALSCISIGSLWSSRARCTEAIYTTRNVRQGFQVCSTDWLLRGWIDRLHCDWLQVEASPPMMMATAVYRRSWWAEISGLLVPIVFSNSLTYLNPFSIVLSFQERLYHMSILSILHCYFPSLQ